MATTTVAAAGTALALYYYSRSRQWESGNETHTNVHSAPKSFLEDLYFFAEGLRYTYGETLGRWRTADLLIGLAYLCKKDSEEHPVADIARHGSVFAFGSSGAEREAALAELRRIERFFRYCSGLRERRPVFQRRYIVEVLGIREEDILRQEVRAGVLKPSFIMVRDPSLNAIVLAVRGTHSFKDAFTSLTGASKPHHVVDTNGVILGYSHFGMLASARWLKGEVGGALAQALAANPGYQLYIIGHSLGGGTAAMLTMMLREQGGPFAEAQCVAIACPACMTLELAKSCAGYVTTVVNCADVIPTISPGSADALREEVMRSSWASDFRQDMRASSIVRAVESGISRVGTATATATTWTATRLSACYQRRPRTQLKRRNSDDGSLLEASTRSRNDNSGPDRDLPLSTSAPESGGALQQLADEGDSQAQATEWTSLTRITSLAAGVTSFTGRQAQVLGRSVSQTASRLASSQANLLRSWTSAQGTVPAVAGEDASPAREGGEGGAAGLDQRGTHLRMEGGRMEMEMDMDEGQGGEDAFGLSDEGVGALDIDGGEGSLSADASVRMREVERAVSAAEEEERAAGASSGDAVPAVIRPGSYGGASPTGRQDTAAWRRMMYPAGRIMHLVPARLVPGLEWNMDDGETEGGSAIDTESEWPEAHMEGGPDLYEHPEPDRAGPSGEPAPVSQHARQVSELSLRDLVSPEEAVGSALVGGGSTSGPLPPMKPAPGPPPEPMVLLDGVPQEAYGRIKLCRTVLSDHVVPNYLRSLATFQERL